MCHVVRHLLDDSWICVGFDEHPLSALSCGMTCPKARFGTFGYLPSGFTVLHGYEGRPSVLFKKRCLAFLYHHVLQIWPNSLISLSCCYNILTIGFYPLFEVLVAVIASGDAMIFELNYHSANLHSGRWRHEFYRKCITKVFFVGSRAYVPKFRLRILL